MVKVGQNIIKILRGGGVGILPTDTIYGLVGSALSEKAVERIYKLKKRGDGKPFIILISKISDLKLFGVELDEKEKWVLKRFWPGPISIVLKCPNLNREMSYLKPINKTLAFRCPNPRWLNVLLKETGPLVAPSANPEGLPPAQNIEQAKQYFTCPVGSPAGDSFGGNAVDFFVDVGHLSGQPSTLIKIENGQTIILREGAEKI